MEDNIFDKVHEIDLKKTMEKSYIDYAMSVIASRALPDVRDGLKPVQRRILYSMIELNNGPDKPHRKSARIVGDTMGKYHPHGDSSIYGALVNMAQEWSTRYPLVDGHGNFGSVDGDGAAAMRYTEARLSKISMELTADINKDTVDFIPNFDETEKEPVVLPSRFPNLLVNGTSGIAVGMATSIPPHNLKEVINAVVKIIDDQIDEQGETSVEDILRIVKGPDFPTGAMILGTRGIEEAYRTGRGKIRVRAITDIEAMPNGKNRIIVTELPYMDTISAPPATSCAGRPIRLCWRPTSGMERFGWSTGERSTAPNGATCFCWTVRNPIITMRRTAWSLCICTLTAPIPMNCAGILPTCTAG